MDDKKPQEIQVIQPRHMGDKAEIRGTNERLLALIPGAADFPRSVVLAAAQIAVMYRLDPIMGEIAIAKMGSKKVNNQWIDQYQPMITLRGHRVLAHRQSNYTCNAQLLEKNHVKFYRGELYDEGDIGVEVTLWRLDVARECKESGVPYQPVKGLGFWRVKARARKDNNGKVTHYTPDEIPETWSAYQVAEKRAELTAIRKAYDLRFDEGVLSDDYDVEVEAVSVMDAQDRATAIQERTPKVQVEPDGEVLYVTEPSEASSQVA